MKLRSKICWFVACCASVMLFIAWMPQSIEYKGFKFPYKKAGLTDKQAAAHLLSRFTFGANQAQIDAAAQQGLENWFSQQLEANLPDDSLNQMLSGYETLNLSNAEMTNTYYDNARILRMAMRDGVISKDSSAKFDKKEYRDVVMAYAKEKGLKNTSVVVSELVNQKILTAAYTNNQLQAVMTHFWFNHFNVSLTKKESTMFMMNYEHKSIKPHVFGKFEDLLMATAKSPAMLTYLDNFRSVASDQNPNSEENARKRMALLEEQLKTNMGDSVRYKAVMEKIKTNKKAQGLNENYAREIMELHTLGVDGGYTQADVTNAAKVFTGWTVFPMTDRYGGEKQVRKMMEQAGEEKLKAQGYVYDKDFLFAANKHDKTEKMVLGQKFAANGGYDEGVQLIHLLASHPSTAKFICKKLAVRFVSDNPPASLLDKMTQTFKSSNGDIKQVLITLVSSPEFWAADALRGKIKSPFELTINTVRVLNAHVEKPYQLFNWINKMGEKIYYYQAPTGFPDKAQFWINTGSLLNRMNFGLAVATQRIPGLSFDLAALNNNHEPESAEAALKVYCKLLMPERNVDESVKRLTPLVNDPDLGKKVEMASGGATSDKSIDMQPDGSDEMMAGVDTNNPTKADKKRRLQLEKDAPKRKKPTNYSLQDLMAKSGTNTMLGQVTGIIIGSPEYQRR